MNNIEQIQLKLAQIKLFAMDVDGTLTDGGVFYSADGLAMKRFSVHDGMGISLLHQSKIETAIISSDESSIPAKRAEKLKIMHVVDGSKRKSIDLEILLSLLKLQPRQVAFIGDDINDIEVLEMCGFSVCPSDAMEIVKNKVDFISDYCGGQGAVRQVCEMILKAQNKPITLNL